MNKKGFTLIELLAVIVIIAVVALILVPVIINVIDSARIGSLKNTAYGLVNSTELYFAQKLGSKIDNNIEFVIKDNVSVSETKLEYNGKVKNAYITVNTKGKIMLCVDNGENYALKRFDSDEVVVDSGVCTGEKDEESLEYLTSSSASYGELKLRIVSEKEVVFPKTASENNILIVTSEYNNKYVISAIEPSTKVENMIWISIDTKSDKYVVSDTSIIPIGNCYQYINGEWVILESYIYSNDNWIQFSPFSTNNWQNLVFKLDETKKVDDIDGFVNDDNLVEKFVNNRDAILYLIENDMLTELKISSSYSNLISKKLLVSEALTNSEKYKYNLPCYLYTPGDVKSDITGGWTKGASMSGGSGSLTSNYMYINLPNEVSVFTSYNFRTVNKMNLTKYKKLYATIYQPTYVSGGNGYSSGGISSHFGAVTGYNSNPTTPIGIVKSFAQLNSATELSLDITSVTSAYLSFGGHAGGGGNDYSKMYMYQMWIE